MKSSKFHINDSITKAYPSKAPQYIKKLNECGVKTFYDLLWIFPLHNHAIPPVRSFSEMQLGEIFQGEGEIVDYRESLSSQKAQFKFKRTPLKNIHLTIKDKHSNLTTTASWFNVYPSLKNRLTQLKNIQFFGRPSEYAGRLQFSMPEIVKPNKYEPERIIQYPTINTIAPHKLKKFIHRMIPKIEFEELLPQSLIDANRLLSLREALFILHGLKNAEKTSKEKAKERIIYQEFYDDQLKVMARKRYNQSLEAPSFCFSQEDMYRLSKIFPYALTPDQEKAIGDIFQDLTQGFPMMRLVQGDVGTGKTSVALIAALAMIEKSYQVALMCPTESLARQHHRSISKLLDGPTLKFTLLLGSTKAAEKKRIYEEIQKGDLKLVIGTHTLFQKKVKFKNLGMAIIDEQHKFGVKQRLALTSKGQGVHTLILTATPIPRSLRLTHFGDLAVSIIKEKPQGRKEIKTRIVTLSKLNQFLSFLKTRIELGEQAYIVLPAIDQSQDSSDFSVQIQNVEKIYLKFKKIFPHFHIAKLHGKMTPEEKTEILEDFYSNQSQMLVSTTVVEVGIDNPNATVMAIINPERFGLSSLHQLRGRVGRGAKPGFCFLVLDKEVSEMSMKRLQVIEETNDGFKIANSDLEIRGEGDLYGLNQSGTNSNSLGKLNQHYDILEKVASDIEQAQEKHDSIVLSQLEQLRQEILVTHTV
jgi:ATP-dependent DNA helicase RecG